MLIVCAGLWLWPRPAGAQPACTLPDDARGTTRVLTLQVDGLDRTYRLYAPENLPDRAVPLVLTLHGFASGAAEQEVYSQWNRLADEHGFIAVYPQGLGDPARWNAGSIGLLSLLAPNNADDVGFLSALIDELIDLGCADPSRVYINGLSNGGGMSHRFACEMAFRVAAFGGVAGAYASFGPCEPSRPVPVIAFHGTADRIVPYAGQGNVLPPIEDWAREWAGRNACADMAGDVPLADDVTVTTWSTCAGGVEVVLYTVADGGHTWPGSSAVNDSPLGRITDSIDASALMWEFFSRYALPMS
jgi:polyhydroxybutyrate depolymerase